MNRARRNGVSQRHAIRRYVQISCAAPIVVLLGIALAIYQMGISNAGSGKGALFASVLYIVALCLMLAGSSLGLFAAIRFREYQSFCRGRLTRRRHQAALWSFSIAEFAALLALSLFVAVQA